MCQMKTSVNATIPRVSAGTQSVTDQAPPSVFNLHHLLLTCCVENKIENYTVAIVIDACDRRKHSHWRKLTAFLSYYIQVWLDIHTESTGTWMELG